METPPLATLAVAFDKPRQRARAEQLAERLSLPLAQRLADPHALHLAVAHTGEDQPDRLELRLNPHVTRGPVGKSVYPNPQSLDTTSPAGRKLNSAIFKAVGIRKGNPHRPHVLDATAGLGEDAWLLAAAGCYVTALERHPVVHALLGDALDHAACTHPDIASRIALQHADLLQRSISTPDAQPQTLYLDPMFPPGRKTAEKKPMRVLRMLVGNNDDADALLDRSLEFLASINGGGGGGRVVVKRPRHAPTLAGREPVHSHEAKALRYDVYIANA